MWADLDLDGTSPTDPGGGQIIVANVTLGGQPALLVEWRDAEEFDNPAGVHTFQIQIFSDAAVAAFDLASPIEVAYVSTTGAPEAVTVGAEGPFGLVGNSSYVDLGMGPTTANPFPAADDVYSLTGAPGGNLALDFSLRATGVPETNVLAVTATASSGMSEESASAATKVFGGDLVFEDSFDGVPAAR